MFGFWDACSVLAGNVRAAEGLFGKKTGVRFGRGERGKWGENYLCCGKDWGLCLTKMRMCATMEV